MVQGRDRRWLKKKTSPAPYPPPPRPIFCPPTRILTSPRSLRGVSQSGTGQDTLNTVLLTDDFPQEHSEDHEQRKAKESASCNCAFKEKERQVWRGFLTLPPDTKSGSLWSVSARVCCLGNSHTPPSPPFPSQPLPPSPLPLSCPSPACNLNK